VSAYATALLESSKAEILNELLRQKDRADEAASEVKRLTEALRLIADTGHGAAKVWFMGNWLTPAEAARAALNKGDEG
jgi:hypothetical protein